MNHIILICTLFTGQASKEGFYMKYDYVFKLNCVELYKNGRWHETPEGIGKKTLEKELLHGSKSLTYTE